MMVSTIEPASAAVTANHIPLIPKNCGRVSIAITWKTKVLINEIRAEIAPLLSAVKKLDPKILKPIKINEMA